MQTRIEHSQWPRRTPSDERSPSSASLLAGTRAGLYELPRLLAHAIERGVLALHTRGPSPLGAASQVLQRAAEQLGAAKLPEHGLGAEAALTRVARVLFEHGLDLTHPAAAAHLQPAPLCVAVAADALASLSNASLDTYDSGPSGIAIERWLIEVLCHKVVASLLAHGRRGFGDMVDRCHALARHAEARVRAEPELELWAPATLTTVVFRCRGQDAAHTDTLNAKVRRALLESGSALIGRTTVRGRVCLKLTLLNPTTSERDLDALFDLILRSARAVAAELAP